MAIKIQLTSLLRECTATKSLFHGKLVHNKIVTLGFQTDPIFYKYLINFYFSCHLYRSATLVLQINDNPSDLSPWNTLLGAYTKNSMFVEALELYRKLSLFHGVNGDEFTFPSVLKACGELGWLNHGRSVHGNVVKTGFSSDVFVSSSLMSLYSRCNVFESVYNVFDEIPDREVTCWNAMITCCHRQKRFEKAVDLFEEMGRVGIKPNSVTIVIAVSSCARLLDLKRGREIHEEAKRTGLVSFEFVQNSLVDMYGKCGEVQLAREVFEQIPKKNLIAWNSVIGAYGLKGDSESCIELFSRMREEKTWPTITTFSILLLACVRSIQLRHGKFIHGYLLRNGVEPDFHLNALLIDFYFKCGTVLSAKNIFETITERNILCWNVMISGFISNKLNLEAIGIYDTMLKVGVKPDAITFTSVLPACSQIAALEKGKEVHKSIKEGKFENDKILMGALIDMYAKSGALDEAIEIFHRLPERDLISWSTMIKAYGSHGRAEEALTFFHEMLKSNLKLDGVAFLAALSACSHGGLVNKGIHYFNLMITEHQIKPSMEHYSCLIDLLGRAGRLNQAHHILQNNPEARDDFDLLSTLLSACYMHKDMELGEEIARLLIEKNPFDPSAYVTLSNLYAYGKKWRELREVRMKMKEMGLRKRSGHSWIQIDKRIETFSSEDKFHSQREKIFHCLRILSSHMDKEDLCPNLLTDNGPQDLLCFDF